MGVYTAAAVGSIAFGLPVPVLDANVERVVARLVALEDNARSPAARRLIRTHLDHHIDTKRPGDFNQAIMELGALVCTPKQPRCNDCPVRTHCRANALNAAERYPRLPEKAPIERVGEIAVVLRQGPEVLILKRPPSGSFADMWELPRGVFFEGEELEDASCRIVAELTGLRCTPRAPILRLRHTVMRQSIELHVIDTSACEGALQLSSHMDAEWTTPEEWHHLPKSTTQAQICDHLRGRLRKRRPETIAPPSEDSTPDLFGDNPQAD
jgi:A/G-specific adenine glycosylase